MDSQKKPVITAHSQPTPQAEVEEQIRRRAYQLYETRGSEEGHDVEDWLQAETELTSTQTRTAAA